MSDEEEKKRKKERQVITSLWSLLLSVSEYKKERPFFFKEYSTVHKKIKLYFSYILIFRQIIFHLYG